jgi:hypothetical protein
VENKIFGNSANMDLVCPIHGYQHNTVFVADDNPGQKYVVNYYCKQCVIDAIEAHVKPFGQVSIFL